MTNGSRACLVAILAVSVSASAFAAPTPAPTSTTTPTSAPMTCSQGPKAQRFAVALTLPRDVEQGSTYSVRIDGVPSGTIAHFGLNYVHDMATDYVVPAGATYVAGSARIVPGTGTPNVAAGARVWQQAELIRMVLPGQVASGSSYTPPSIEFQLKATAPAGASLALRFLEYRVAANAFLVGEVQTSCEPTPKPYTLGATRVIAPTSSQ